jgi:hypothetical protein
MLRVCRNRLRVKRRNVARRTACKTDLRQPEVENLGVPALSDKNIGRLDVAMDDALRVGRIQSIGNFNGDGKKSFLCQLAPSDRCTYRQLR